MHGRWHGIYLHGIYVVDDMEKKQWLFIFVDHCVVFIATNENVFNAHKICEIKKFLPKIGNICSIVLSFPNLRPHLNISIIKKIHQHPF